MDEPRLGQLRATGPSADYGGGLQNQYRQFFLCQANRSRQSVWTRSDHYCVVRELDRHVCYEPGYSGALLLNTSSRGEAKTVNSASVLLMQNHLCWRIASGRLSPPPWRACATCCIAGLSACPCSGLEISISG